MAKTRKRHERIDAKKLVGNQDPMKLLYKITWLMFAAAVAVVWLGGQAAAVTPVAAGLCIVAAALRFGIVVYYHRKQGARKRSL